MPRRDRLLRLHRQQPHPGPHRLPERGRLDNPDAGSLQLRREQSPQHRTVDLSPATSRGRRQGLHHDLTYDSTSRRVAGVTQSDGTSLAFTYVLVGVDYRVATVKYALNTSHLPYDTVARRTTVTDALGFKTRSTTTCKASCLR